MLPNNITTEPLSTLTIITHTLSQKKAHYVDAYNSAKL